MAHRHKVHRRAHGGRTVYAGAGSNVAKEAGSTHDHFKHGGHKVHGGAAKARLDKRARGGGVGKSPFSSAAYQGEDTKRTTHTKDHCEPRKHGGRAGRPHHMTKHEHNFGAHHGAGHEEPHEHHLPVHHKHGGRQARKHGGRAEGGSKEKENDDGVPHGPFINPFGRSRPDKEEQREPQPLPRYINPFKKGGMQFVGSGHSRKRHKKHGGECDKEDD